MSEENKSEEHKNQAAKQEAKRAELAKFVNAIQGVLDKRNEQEAEACAECEQCVSGVEWVFRIDSEVQQLEDAISTQQMTEKTNMDEQRRQEAKARVLAHAQSVAAVALRLVEKLANE